MKKRLSGLILGTMAVAALLGGCGGSGKTESAAEPVTTAQAAGGTEAAGGAGSGGEQAGETEAS